MKVAEFDFELPRDLIAQEPEGKRDASRLMVVDRRIGALSHRRFCELALELDAGDLVVLNDAKVIPARLRGVKPTGGQIEALLLEPVDDSKGASVWRALLSGSKSVRPGTGIAVSGGLRIVPLAREGDLWRVELVAPGGDIWSALETSGEIPLPSYIRRGDDDPRAEFDRERYQTVYARARGAVAAPTAGLHFTKELLSGLEARGIEVAFITLQVGLGTFAPVRVADVEAHEMHDEAFALPVATAEAVRRARSRGRRVVAVGTTVVRTLEERADERGDVRPGTGRSALFIYPGFRFRVVDALVTNFHLPRSTLLMLVCAFAGTSAVLSAYRVAVQERYRFYSYGDAMLVRSG